MLKNAFRALALLAVASTLSATAEAGLYGTVDAANFAKGVNGGGVFARLFAANNQVVTNISTASGGQLKYSISNENYIAPVTGLVETPAASNIILTWCLELNDHISAASVKYDIDPLSTSPDGGAPPPTGAANGGGPPMGAQAAGWIRELWTHAIASVTDATHAAAFQLAIWKLEYDHSYLSDGNTYTTAIFGNETYDMNLQLTDVLGVTGVVLTNAQLAALSPTGAVKIALGWINDVLNNNYKQANLVALRNATFQDQLAEVTGELTPDNPVPEPFSLAVWGVLGLAGIACGRRKTA